MARLTQWDRDSAHFSAPGAPDVVLTAADLIECAPAQFDGHNGQRRVPLSELPAAPMLTGAETTANGWSFQVNPGGEIGLTEADLAPYLDPVPSAPTYRLWLRPEAALADKFD